VITSNPEGGSRKRDVPVVASDAGKSVFGRGFSRSSLDGEISSEFPRRVSPSFGEAVAESVDEENGLVYLDKLTSTKNNKLTSTKNNKLTSTKNNTSRYGIDDALRSKDMLIFHRKYELVHIPDGVSTLLSKMSLDPFDFKASIVGYYRYWSEARSQTVYIPNVTGAKANPCMRLNKVYASVSRTVRRLDSLVAVCDLKSPYMVDLVLTIPPEVSNALYVSEGGGEKIVWDAYKAFLKDLDQFFTPQGELGSWRLGMNVNLHKWKSELPFGLPHYHFHSLFPNYVYNRASARFVRFQPYFSEVQRRDIRSLWLKRIHELGDAVDVPTDDYTADEHDRDRNKICIDIHFSYISMVKPPEEPAPALVEDSEDELRGKKDAACLYAKKRRARAVLIHKLKYKARPFMSDFVEWFPDNSTFAANLDLDALKRMIQLTGSDRTRTFGFIRRLAGCVEDVVARSEGGKAGKTAKESYKVANGASPMLKCERDLIRKSVQDPEGFGELVFECSVGLSDLPPCPIVIYSRSGRTVIPPPEVKSKEG